MPIDNRFAVIALIILVTGSLVYMGGKMVNAAAQEAQDAELLRILAEIRREHDEIAEVHYNIVDQLQDQRDSLRDLSFLVAKMTEDRQNQESEAGTDRVLLYSILAATTVTTGGGIVGTLKRKSSGTK